MARVPKARYTREFKVHAVSMAKPSVTSRNTLNYFTTGNDGKRRSGIFHRLPLPENFKRNSWAEPHRLASEFDDLVC